MRRRTLMVVLAGVVLVAGAACRPDSPSKPEQFTVDMALIKVQGVDTAFTGHVGLDILLADNYNPCHQRTDANGTYHDSFYAACQDSRHGPESYFKYWNFTAGGPQLASAMSWRNTESNVCRGKAWCPAQPAVITTNWARKTSHFAIEFYPHNATEGGVRLQGAMQNGGPGWSSSPDLGVVHLPKVGEPGISRILGSVAGGSSASRFRVDAFQTEGAWLRTSTGYTELGFASVYNVNGRDYITNPLPHGTYYIVVNDTQTGGTFGTSFNLNGDRRLDINPTAPCLGLSPAFVPHTTQRLC